MKRVVVIAFVIGCHGGHEPTARPPTRTPYLALFEKGHAWTLGKATCRVTEVKPVGDASVAHLTCDAPNAGLLVNGTWVATPGGLYHPLLPIDDPDELALLGDADLLLAANATEGSHEHLIEGTHVSNEAFVHESSWCVRQTTVLGPESRSFTLCFAPAGITGIAEAVVSNGVTTHAEFGSVPVEEAED